MYINEIELKVRYVETDKMGIVHHSNYYHWFEAGRTEYIENLGVTYAELEERGMLLPLSESYCKYKQGAKYGDTVIIKTWIEVMRTSKIIFAYSVHRKEDNKLLAEGKTTHGIVNQDFKIINIKKVFPDINSKLVVNAKN